jgi:hypothetical protein
MKLALFFQMKPRKHTNKHDEFDFSGANFRGFDRFLTILDIFEHFRFKRNDK